MIPLDRIPIPTLDALKGHCVDRLAVMKAYRLSWWSHWASLAELYLPRRYRWFVTPNQYSRGSPMNQSIVDETGVLAARTLATGLLSGLTSPTKPWFRLGLKGVKDLPEGAAKEWLAACTKLMLEVYAGSNFYTALGTAYHDNCVFGSAALIQYEDRDDVVNFINPCLGEFCFGLSKKLTVDTLYREYTYTVSEAVKEFGLENLSESTRTMARTASNLDTEIVIAHAIEPNGPVYSGGQEVSISALLPKRFPYREVYWEQTSSSTQRAGFIVRVAGFPECPFVGLRWDVTSNDAYGRSPGMDGLPAVRQLQIEQRRKAEAIDKMVRPPVVASVSMKNEPVDLLPGGVTYAVDVANSGMKPVFQVEPRIQEMMLDLKEVQLRVTTVFFNDLFRMISDLQTVRTATEIDARQQEKLILLGPVIERTENEGLDEIIERTFSIMSRKHLFPDAPPEIAGHPIQIEYISILAEAQRAASTTAIERWLSLGGSIAALAPDIMDNYKTDEIVDYYSDLLNVPPELVRAAAEVAQIRAHRAQMQQAQAALQVGQAAAEGAQTLSQTDVGGGKNALQSMLGTPG